MFLSAWKLVINHVLMAVICVFWKGFVDRSCLNITKSRTDQPVGLYQACWGPVRRKEWISITADYSSFVKTLSQLQGVGDQDQDTHKAWIHGEQSPWRALAFEDPFHYEWNSSLLVFVHIWTHVLACRVSVLTSPPPQEKAGQALRAAPLYFHFFQKKEVLVWWERGFC